MTYHFTTLCPRCRKTGEIVHRTPSPVISCGNCLMDSTEVVYLELTSTRPCRNGHPLPEGQTPAARWREEGKEDPHGARYECERAQLAGGHMTDDEVANAVYMDPGINNLTIAKDRIRWLSRSLVNAKEESKQLRTRVARAESSLDTYDEHRDARYWRDFKDRMIAP